MKTLSTMSSQFPKCDDSIFRPILWQDAERILGFRIDRRRSYYFCDDPEMNEYFCGGPVYDYGEWVTSCSGCRETEDGHNVGHYEWDNKAKCYIGAGCSECGYTGKRREGMFAPVKMMNTTVMDGHLRNKKKNH